MRRKKSILFHVNQTEYRALFFLLFFFIITMIPGILDDLMSGSSYQNIDSPLQYQLQLLQASSDDGQYELWLKNKVLTDYLANTWKLLAKVRRKTIERKKCLSPRFHEHELS